MKRLGSTYGFDKGDLELVRAEVQRMLGVCFEEHESSYLGEYYLAKTEQSETVQLMANFNPAEQELNEPEFPNMPVLAHITDIRDDERSMQIRMLLETGGGRLLKIVE